MHQIFMLLKSGSSANVVDPVDRKRAALDLDAGNDADCSMVRSCSHAYVM